MKTQDAAAFWLPHRRTGLHMNLPLHVPSHKHVPNLHICQLYGKLPSYWNRKIHSSAEHILFLVNYRALLINTNNFIHLKTE